jgi:hypothetical protein
MTLNDLREQTKTAYVAFRYYREKGLDQNPEWMNMMEAWRFCWRYYSFGGRLEMGLSFRKEYHHLTMNLAKAGDAYYYAKKHGIQATLLRRLTNDSCHEFIELPTE